MAIGDKMLASGLLSKVQLLNSQLASSLVSIFLFVNDLHQSKRFVSSIRYCYFLYGTEVVDKATGPSR